MVGEIACISAHAGQEYFSVLAMVKAVR